ncbi:MAG: hypothetical protein AAGA02_03035 [Bacteroidota bacterium]
MKKIFVVAISMLLCLTAYSQNDSPITYRKAFGGYVFEQDGKALKPKQMLDIFQNNEAAYKAMKKAKANYDPAIGLSFVGGTLVGWPLGTALGGGDPNWALAGIGAGLIIAAIPLGSAFNKHAIRAVDLFNGDNDKSSTRLYYGLTNHGLGLELRF